MASLKGSCHGHLAASFRFLIWKLSPLWSEKEGLRSARGQSSGHVGAKETVQKGSVPVTGVKAGLATPAPKRAVGCVPYMGPMSWRSTPGPLPLPTTYRWNKFSSSSFSDWGSTSSCHLLPSARSYPPVPEVTKALGCADSILTLRPSEDAGSPWQAALLGGVRRHICSPRCPAPCPDYHGVTWCSGVCLAHTPAATTTAVVVLPCGAASSRCLCLSVCQRNLPCPLPCSC